MVGNPKDKFSGDEAQIEDGWKEYHYFSWFYIEMNIKK